MIKCSRFTFSVLPQLVATCWAQIFISSSTEVANLSLLDDRGWPLTNRYISRLTCIFVRSRRLRERHDKFQQITGRLNKSIKIALAKSSFVLTSNANISNDKLYNWSRQTNIINESVVIILLRIVFIFLKTFDLSSSLPVNIILRGCSPWFLSSAKPDSIQEMRDAKKTFDLDLLESLDNQQLKVSVRYCSIAWLLKITSQWRFSSIR